MTQENHDQGDEDDSGSRDPLARWRWRFIRGKTIHLFPAEELPPLPDDDVGDEQPRLRARFPDWWPS